MKVLYDVIGVDNSRRNVVHMIKSAKSRYYQDKLTTTDSKETFRVINSLMN